MTTVAWLVVVLALGLALVALRNKPAVAEQFDEKITNFAIAICLLVGSLAAIYGLVRFVRWAWYN